MDFLEFPPEIVDKIFSNLSLRERFSLKLCSKVIHAAAVNAPLFHKHVIFGEINYWRNEEKKTALKLYIDDILLTFHESEKIPNATHIGFHARSSFNEEEGEIIENSTFREVAKTFLQDYVFRDNVVCYYFETNYPITEDFLSNLKKLKVKMFRGFSRMMLRNAEDDEPLNAVALWLKHMNPRHLQSVAVYMDSVECMIKEAENELCHVKTLHLLRKSDIDDEMLDGLRALDIELEPAKITVKGINKLIRKWIDKKVPRGSRFVYYIEDPKHFQMEELIKDVPNPKIYSSEKTNFPISSNEILQIWVTNSNVNIECMKRK